MTYINVLLMKTYIQPHEKSTYYILLDWVLIGQNSTCKVTTEEGYKHFVGRHRYVSECAAACRKEGPHFIFTRSDSNSMWCNNEECPCFCYKSFECKVTKDSTSAFHDVYTYRGK